MLRTSLPRNHHQFLGADPLGIHISKNLQPRRRQLAQTKICHFHPLLLLRRDQYPRPPQQFRGSQRNFTVLQRTLTPSLYNIATRGVSILESRARGRPSSKSGVATAFSRKPAFLRPRNLRCWTRFCEWE